MLDMLYTYVANIISSTYINLKKNIFNLIQFNHVFDMPRIKYNARHFLVFRANEFVYFEATRKLQPRLSRGKFCHEYRKYNIQRKFPYKLML